MNWPEPNPLKCWFKIWVNLQPTTFGRWEFLNLFYIGNVQFWMFSLSGKRYAIIFVLFKCHINLPHVFKWHYFIGQTKHMSKAYVTLKFLLWNLGALWNWLKFLFYLERLIRCFNYKMGPTSGLFSYNHKNFHCMLHVIYLANYIMFLVYILSFLMTCETHFHVL